MAVNGKDLSEIVPPSSLIRRVSSKSIRNSISEDKENGDINKSFVSKYKKTPEALKGFHNDDSELEVPGTPMTPRTSTTPGAFVFVGYLFIILTRDLNTASSAYVYLFLYKIFI